MPAAFFLVSLLTASTASAYVPGQDLFASPALLVDYRAWGAGFDRFQEPESETRAFRGLVEILYDHDNGRPWGARYFPEANARLEAFRARLCPALPQLKSCFLPSALATHEDIAKLQANVLDAPSLAALSARWGLTLRPWALPLREPVFSLVAGTPAGDETVRAVYWNMTAADVPWTKLASSYLWDAANYRAGFDGKEIPAYLTLNGAQVALNDWQLRDRAMDFAAGWKHAATPGGWVPENPVVDAEDRLRLRLLRELAPELERTYATLLEKVSAVPAVKERFEKTRARGEFPEEVFQHVAYAQLREILRVQGNYLSLASAQRKQTSARQQVLESLLTVQRYGTAPTTFALELTSLMTPFTSHAAVLDEMADFPLAQTFTLEQLRALLGVDAYEKHGAMFPALGRGLLAAELFRDSYLDEYAPDLKKELAGRDFATLPAEEQLRLLRLYLSPEPGKVRAMALFRLGACYLGAASDDELRAVAERVHEVRAYGFK